MATKTTIIVADLADELEALIGDYITGACGGYGNPDSSRRSIQNILKNAGCPNDVRAALFMRMDSAASDLQMVKDDLTRDNIDSAAENLKALDEYLGKRFKVTGLKGRNPTYRWAVWS